MRLELKCYRYILLFYSIILESLFVGVLKGRSKQGKKKAKYSGDMNESKYYICNLLQLFRGKAFVVLDFLIIIKSQNKNFGNFA